MPTNELLNKIKRHQRPTSPLASEVPLAMHRMLNGRHATEPGQTPAKYIGEVRLMWPSRGAGVQTAAGRA